jgi:hypothetical protein
MRLVATLSAIVFLTLPAQAQQLRLQKSAFRAAPKNAALLALSPGKTYTVTLSLGDSLLSQGNSEHPAILSCGNQKLGAKLLHAGDADWTLATAVHSPCSLSLQLGAANTAPPLSLTVHEWNDASALEQEPNNSPSTANRIRLGKVIFAAGDDSPYLPPPSFTRGKPTPEMADDPAGHDWYVFRFDGAPQLISFQLDLMERDNLPVDVSLFRLVNGKPVLFTEGEDPVSIPHEVQALPGNKYTTRLLREPGDYYIRVTANHPEYRLRTRLYPPPPYKDPQQAVRTALDFLLGAGDSWHANTPRRGGILDRVASSHQETSLCVACHVTHFTQRAQLYAAKQGYPVHHREALRFMTERFYNNPRPLYGFEEQGATWARVISAPANVLGRMSHLMQLFESQVSHEPRPAFHDGVKKYLELYYTGRTKLPPDETNGNQPLVSNYEVAWYAWEVSRDPAIVKLIEQDDHKNLIDLSYQTLALASIDKQKYAPQIQRNATRILSLQRPSGQWSMKFEPAEKDVEFQTGHALWALAAAGLKADHPQVKKGLDHLLSRQQDFGGWLDPLQSFENFRTPFRETQMAVLALSAFFPNGPAVNNWGSTFNGPLGSDSALLENLSQVWDAPNAATLAAIRKAAVHSDAFIRQAAIEALGRLVLPEDEALFARKLSDPSKLVMRTSAWALRQFYSRRGAQNTTLLQTALQSKDARQRWGATRVFATHFSALSRQPALAQALALNARAPQLGESIQALKGLWQMWFWTPDTTTKATIEDTFLAALQKPQHPWVERNLHEGIYNLADENIRYLYNNWVPAIARPADQERLIRGRLAHESRLAEKFSSFLDKSTDTNRKRLLAALTEFQLRRADTYDLAADPHSSTPPVYNRIGNDIEQSVFFGQANTRFATALIPLQQSPDADLRRLATQAGLLTRDARFSAVTALAGQPGKERDTLVTSAKQNVEDPTNLELLKAFNAAPRPKAPAGGPGGPRGPMTSRAARPDESYFRGYVQPILEKRGKDGYACVQCHASHAIFDGTPAKALNVINLDSPEESLILLKPTASAESEGVAGSKQTAHGGGIRFEKDSPEYNTILNWIRGAKP